MITLGIDVGTTHTKVLALDIADGTTKALQSAATPLRRSAEGEAHPAPEVLETVIELVSRVAAELAGGTAVVALCAASVGEEVVLLDRAGRPVGDTIAWYDLRGFEEAAGFMAGAGGELALSKRWPPDPSFSIFKLLWTRHHQPATYATARSWTDLGDYVLAGLGADVVMDWSHASRAGAFDLERRAWDRETIEAAGLGIAFPRLLPSGSVVGTLRPDVAARTGLSEEVAIVSGGHDHLCAAYGAGVRTPAELFLSAGTSEAHLAVLDTPRPVSSGRHRIDQGCYVDGGSYYAHANIHSGHFFRQWRRLLFEHIDEEAMYAAVAAVPAGAGGVRFELLDDHRRGRLDNVPYGADGAVLMRAVLEGLARHSADIVTTLEAARGCPFGLIVVAGRPTRVALWKELRMAAYGRPVAAVDEQECTAFGAAVMAAQALGLPGADDLVAHRSAWT